MNKLDYKRFEELLYRDCCRIIEDFSKTENNKDVYSFCIYNHLGHGDIVLFINTLESFNKKRQSGDYHYDEGLLYGLRSLKYSVDDFGLPFEFSKEINDFALEHASAEWAEYEGWDPIIESAIHVCNQLGDSFNLLNQTEDFISFTINHDTEYDEQINLMKETIELEQLYAAFPEIAAFERLLSDLREKSRDDQMDYLLAVFEDFATGTESTAVRLIKTCRRDKYDVKNIIKGFGKDITHKLMVLLQKYGKCEELHHEFASLPKEERAKRVKEDHTGKLSVWTTEGKITHELIGLIKSTGGKEIIESLHELLQFWFTKTNFYPYDGIGRNVSLLAKLLNYLSPEQFPSPSLDRKGQLINYSDFNLSL